MTAITYSLELAEKFCAAIADGGSLRSVCAKKDMPAKATVFRWLREHPEFAKMYEQATDDRADAQIEEIVDLADKCAIDRDAVAKVKLQIYARIEAAQKMKPRKYGTKVQLTGDGGGAIHVRTAAAYSDDELAAIAAGAKCS